MEEVSFDWNETWFYMELRFPVSAGASSKDVKVTIKPQRLEVQLKRRTLASGDLQGVIYPDDSTWYISRDGAGNRELIVELCKRKTDKLWHRVFDWQTFVETRIEGKRYREMGQSEYNSVQQAFQFTEQQRDLQQNPNFITGSTIFERME